MFTSPSQMKASAIAVLAGCALAAASVGCKKNEGSSQKNFVAKFDESFIHFVAWPAYSSSQAETFVALSQGARNYTELFASARTSNLGSLLSPELCWFGKSTSKKLVGADLGEVYLDRDPAYSSTKSVPCAGLMQAMAANPKLSGLAGRIKERAAAMGADECTYLVIALTPNFGSVLLANMRAKGIPMSAPANGAGPVPANSSGDGTRTPANGTITAPGNGSRSQPPIMGLDGK